MANKMLIDATHPEETRVVVTRGNRVEEFDYESASRKQLRGNIYLAKVARIEPSLQAAFVNYGGNRHGFLAFAEIHPDYYQIPLAVREAILKEEALDRANARNETSSNGNGQDGYREQRRRFPESDAEFKTETQSDEDTANAENVDGQHPPEHTLPSTLNHPAEPEDNAASDAQDSAGAEADAQPAYTERNTAIPLEAVLPAVIYEEFTAAVARGNDAADEIPSHPDDVETVAETTKTAVEPDGGTADAANSFSRHEPSNAADLNGEDQPSWDSQPASDDSGIITVPETAAPAPVEVVGSEDALEELPQRAKRRWRHYKIQEVIKRNQIVLIQVVKEERGTKGAALTTYLSLAGRYTVLMPNTASGGGISRKITVPADRKRLKEIAQELEVPEGMGLIIRTAGASRTKAEIKRDFEYLLRLWETVRDLTLKSTAPCLVYEESDLIKRSIRDLYNKEIDEILVAGDTAYREAREFMRMLMPSHAKNVQLYKEPEPLFTRFEVERQLNQMFSPVVTLKSGGYIVINQTEALVAIDVNSGRSTREYSIESTALNTNLEASDEVARQVRLRDLAGLIVIDYIDMDERRNNRAVERRLKEALRHDRARIQVGHISHFGLMEMSRQRLRQGVVEVSTMPCPICQGVGHIRSTESVGLMILRSVEDHLRTQGAANLNVSVAAEAALYILNHKRAYLHDIELRYGVSIVIAADEKARGAHFTIDRGAEATPPPLPARVAEVPKSIHVEPAIFHAQDDGDGETGEEISGETEEQRSSRRRRRRRRGGRDGQALNGSGNGAGHQHSQNRETNGSLQPPPQTLSIDVPATDTRNVDEAVAGGTADAETGEDSDGLKRNRRRGRRGGRRHRGLENNGGSLTAQPETSSIPGFGEQPSVPFGHDFPVNQANTGIPARALAEDAAVKAEPENGGGIEQAITGGAVPAQSVAAGFTPASATVADTMPISGTMGPVLPSPGAPLGDHEPVDTTDRVAVAESSPMPAGQVENAPEPVPPAAEPKPKPVRTGPARKGWWQRGIG